VGLKLKLTAPSGAVARCPACGLGQTLDLIEPADLARLYDDDYLKSHLPDRPDAREEERLRRPLDLARRFKPAPARLLEVGVGRGWLLKWAADLGYQVMGADLSPQAARSAEKTSGARVLVGPLQDLGLPAQSQEVVVLRHVLEHVPRPVEFLAEIGRILSPNGLVVGSMPNFKSFKAWLDGPRWCFLMLPSHRLHFSPRALRRLLTEAGFEVAALQVRELVLYDRALFQSVLNRLRRLLGWPEAPTGYDPTEVEVNSLITWVLAQEHRFHRLLARLRLGEEIVFAGRRT